MPLYYSAFELEAERVQRKLERFLVGCTVVFLGKCHERSKRYSVASADEIHIVIAHRNTQHGENAGRTARCRTQPQDIVIAPLDVDIRVLHECVQKPRRLGASVEDVPDYVQLIHRKPLYYIRKSGNDLVGGSR